MSYDKNGTGKMALEKWHPEKWESEKLEIMAPLHILLD